MTLSFFKKQRPPKRFEYQPRYYNESKERIEQLKKQQVERNEQENHHESAYIPNIKGKWTRERKPGIIGGSRNNKWRVIIMVVSVLLLLAMMYLIAILTSYIIQYA